MSEVTAAPAAAPTSAPEASAAPENAAEVSATQESAKKKAPPAFRKFKIGDEEVALTDADIERDYKKWKGSDKAFREAAEQRKEVENFKKALAENPELILNDPRLPFDKRKLAEKWFLESLEAELSPPDPRDLKLTAAEKKLKEYEEKEARELQAREEAERTAAVEYRKSELSKVLAQAMEATQLSKHPESAASVLREMAIYMRTAKERGVDVSPQELVEHIHNSRFHQMYTLAHSYDGDELIEFLGEEITNRIRKADIARIRKQREQAQQHKDQSWAPDTKAPAPKMDAISARRHAQNLLNR